MPWKACCILLHSVPRGARYTTFPVSLCASAVSRALLSLASVLERALVSLPTQLHSGQSQFCTKDLHFLLWRHGMELTAAFSRSPEGTQLQCMLPVTHKNIYTYCTVHMAHMWGKVYYGAKMKVIVQRHHKPTKTNKTSWGQKERQMIIQKVCLFSGISFPKVCAVPLDTLPGI